MSRWTLRSAHSMACTYTPWRVHTPWRAWCVLPGVHTPWCAHSMVCTIHGVHTPWRAHSMACTLPGVHTPWCAHSMACTLHAWRAHSLGCTDCTLHGVHTPWRAHFMACTLPGVHTPWCAHSIKVAYSLTSNFGPPPDLKNVPSIPHLALFGLKMAPFGSLFAWAPMHNCWPCGSIVTSLLSILYWR